MDGLLLDTEGSYKIAWVRAAAELGHSLTDAIYASAIGVTIADAEKNIKGHLGDGFDLEKFRPLAASYYEKEIAKGIPLKTGVRELLDWADANKIPCAVGTSTFHAEAVERLQAHGLDGRFKTVIGGDMVAKGKPDPEIFIRAAEGIDIRATKCLVLEDGYSGVRAAQAVGMPVYLIPDLLEPDAKITALSSGIFPSLLAVRDHLESLPAA